MFNRIAVVALVISATTFSPSSQAADWLVNNMNSFSYSIETTFLKDVLTAQVAGLNFESVPGKVVFGVTSANLDKVKGDMSVNATSLLCQGAASVVDPVDSCVAYTRFSTDGVKTEDMEVKDAAINIDAGKMKFNVNLKGIGNFKGEGTAAHDAAAKVVTLKINKVKLSILDVTGQFFSQLGDIKSDMIRVERPYIYISYGKKAEPTH